MCVRARVCVCDASDAASAVASSPRVRARRGCCAVPRRRGVVPREQSHRARVPGPRAPRGLQPPREPGVEGERALRVRRDPHQGDPRRARARRGGESSDALLADAPGKVRRPQRQKIRGDRPVPPLRKRGRHLGGEADAKRRRGRHRILLVPRVQEPLGHAAVTFQL